MIDSTNPRIMADNIRHLSKESGSQASDISTLQATATAQGNAIEALGSYSVTEIDTGKKWLGDNIYRKVFIVDSMPNNTTLTIAHNISDLGVVTLLYGVMQPKGNAVGRFIPTANNPGISIGGPYIYIGTTSNYSEQSAIVVIEYTKSASPSPDLALAPDDIRSINLEEIPDAEDEPEPIEEKK